MAHGFRGRLTYKIHSGVQMRRSWNHMGTTCTSRLNA